MAGKVKLTKARLVTAKQKELVLLAIIASMRGETDVSDHGWHWMQWFCDDNDHGDDTFNRCINKGWLGCTHDSDTDHSIAFITPAGRAALSQQTGSGE